MKRGFYDWALTPDVIKHKAAFIQIGPRIKIYVINDFEMVKELFAKDIFSYRNPIEFHKVHRFMEYDKEKRKSIDIYSKICIVKMLFFPLLFFLSITMLIKNLLELNCLEGRNYIYIRRNLEYTPKIFSEVSKVNVRC